MGLVSKIDPGDEIRIPLAVLEVREVLADGLCPRPSVDELHPQAVQARPHVAAAARRALAGLAKSFEAELVETVAAETLSLVEDLGFVDCSDLASDLAILAIHDKDLLQSLLGADLEIQDNEGSQAAT